MAIDPFPRSALDANRSGHLTPEQATFYRAEASTDRKNLLLAGLAVMAFGAIILFGAITGRIPGGRVEPLLLGAAIFAFGVALAYFGGIRGSAAKSAAVAAGRVTRLEGPFSRDRRDRREFEDHVATGNEYEYYLNVGERSFSVSEEAWKAAPEDGVVRVYLLGDSDRIVNLEKIADAPPPQVPGFVRGALERAAASGDPRAAQAQAMLHQAEAMRAAAGASSQPPPAVSDGPIGQAILGTWRNDGLGMTYEFRADGSAIATMAVAGTREQHWSVAGVDTIRLDKATLHASVAGGSLWLGEPERLLQFTRLA